MPRIYRLYIDESGEHSYGKNELQRLRIKFKDKTIDYQMGHYPELEKEEKRYLSLTGCIVETEKFRSFRPSTLKKNSRGFWDYLQKKRA